MQIRWRGLELPTRACLDESTATDKYGLFVVEPFERGFGTTVGNSLRRVLLSSIEGSAVTWIKIDGVSNEFSSIPGVVEDVTDIILNVKSLVIKSHADEPKLMKLSGDKKGPLTAGMIQADPAIEIFEPDRVIATLAKDGVKFDLTMEVCRGRGYVPAAENAAVEQEIGVIPVDSVFSPVKRVRYLTENTRLGQRTNYDRLKLEIWTDGTISPELALVEGGKIIRKHLNPFVQYFELGHEQAAPVDQTAEEKAAESQAQRHALLSKPLVELEMSVRAANCLQMAKIHTVQQLVTLSDSDLLKVRSFGKTSLREIKRKLADLGLSLGMTPEDLDNVPVGAQSQ
ncbi:MAG: DNA-directed RNA polymerase subunit alpha [Actinobacteria bacterium]|nr:DNA-directed RNA polymerase subunit alpha [Actinomycetota bacterium]